MKKMGMEKLVSIGERLERLLADADRDGKAKVAEAEKRAEEMVSRAKAEATRRLAMAQRGTGIDELLKEAEKKAGIEADRKLKDYEERAEALKATSMEKIEEAISLVLKEVLPGEQ